MAGFRFRLIDTAGSELAIVSYAVPNVREDQTIYLPGGRAVRVLEVYDDEHGQEGGVAATLWLTPSCSSQKRCSSDLPWRLGVVEVTQRLQGGR